MSEEDIPTAEEMMKMTIESSLPRHVIEAMKKSSKEGKFYAVIDQSSITDAHRIHLRTKGYKLEEYEACDYSGDSRSRTSISWENPTKK